MTSENGTPLNRPINSEVHWHVDFVRDSYQDSALDVVTVAPDTLIVHSDNRTAVRITFSDAGDWAG